MALNKKNRLKKKRDFEEVFKNGKTIKGVFLFIKFKKNDVSATRFGFIVSVKVSRKAVERNKLRRIFSEIVQTALKDINGFDLIVFATNRTKDATREEIAKDLVGLLKNIK